MKTRTIFVVLLVADLLCILTACSSSTLSGKYEIVNVLDDPEGITFAELSEMYTEMGLSAKDYFYMEFSGGNRFKLIMFGKEEATGTYTLDGSVLMLTAEAGATPVDVSGKKITWTYMNGGKLVFKKK